jgi:hypothetical protein
VFTRATSLLDDFVTFDVIFAREEKTKREPRKNMKKRLPQTSSRTDREILPSQK